MPCGLIVSTCWSRSCALLHNHGGKYRRVLASVAAESCLAKSAADSHLLAAAVVYAVREEMARTLADVLFRRTDLATGEVPTEGAVSAAAELIAAELGWCRDRIRRETTLARTSCPRWRRRRSTTARDAHPVL
jgi:glycerol-3-phosphate dehydrogenase